ncbi:MAG: DUF6515 family protein [Bacteroidota bacterium]
MWKIQGRYVWIYALVFTFFIGMREGLSQSQIRTQMKRQHVKRYRWGKKVKRLPQHAKVVSISDSIQYWYKAGTFFQPWWGKFEVVPPPVGIEIPARPAGYIVLHVSGIPYFYYRGMYLIKRKGTYSIVSPPEGAEVFFLPGKAEYKFLLDNREFFWLNGIYYEKFRDETGYPAFRVVGVTLSPSSLPSP